MNHQSRFDAWYRVLGAGALGWPRGMVRGERWEEGFRMGNMCMPVAGPCWCVAEPIQYRKVISLQFKEKKESVSILVFYKWSSFGASLVAQKVKHLPAMQETRVWSLDWEDPLEKETATHSSTLAWKIPWPEEPGRLHTVHGVTKSQTQLSNFTFFLSFTLFRYSNFIKKTKKRLTYVGLEMRRPNL